jgi:hypothetical protein
MSVSDGNLANQSTFNSSFMSREVDTTTVGKVDLLNAVPASGANVINIQKFINSVASALGMTTAEVYNFLFTYSSDVVGASNNTVLARLNALTEKFRGGLGLSHTHSGVDGQGEKVSASNLLNINQYFAEWQAAVAISVTGNSTLINAQMSGKTAGGGVSALGVITLAPDNKVMLFNNVNGESFEDAEGQKVFGRVTESAGTWTLTYYTNEAGVETSYSFGSAVDIQLFFLEVFSLSTRPTIPSTPEFGSLDITGDVVDATATVRGVVNTVAQAFGGKKDFDNGISINSILDLAQDDDTVATGATATLSPTQPFVIYINSGLTGVAGITASPLSYVYVLLNKTGADIDLLNNNAGASASDRILIPGGDDIKWKTNQSIFFIYDQTNSRWVLAGGASVSLGPISTGLEYSFWWGSSIYGIHAISGDTDIVSNGDVYKFGSTDATSSSMHTADLLFESGSNVGLGGATSNSGGLYFTSGSVDGTSSTGEVYFASGDNLGSGNSGAYSIRSGNVTGSGDSGPIIIYAGNVTSGTRGDLDVNVNRSIFRPDTDFVITKQASFRLIPGIAANDNAVGFKPPASIVSEIIWTLPNADGSANQVLKTNGAGILSWATPAGSVTFGKQNFTLIAGDITNQYIDLSQVILANSLDFMLNGLIYNEGIDYTVNLTGGAGGNTRITFAGDLATGGASPLAIGDVVYVKYNY